MVVVSNGPALTHYSNAHSVWTDATCIITHHNAHCWTGVDRRLESFYIAQYKVAVQYTQAISTFLSELITVWTNFSEDSY